MRCSRAWKKLMLFEDRDAPASLRTHLESCPACRRVRDQTAAVRLLMALKRHEHADPGFEDRCAARIYASLKTAPQPGHAAWIFPAWEPLPILRLATVAVMMGLITFHFWAAHLQALPSISADLADSPRLAAEPQLRQAPAIGLTMEDYGAPLVTRMLIQPPASNPGPDRLQYGPVSSQPVSFDY